MRAAALRVLAATSLGALIVLCLAWELRLAPLRPGGSWWAIKALPLTLPLGGILAGRRYTYQWSSMLMLAYFVEGVTRSLTERGLSQTLAAIEVILSVTFIVAAIGYARAADAGLNRPRITGSGIRR